MLNSWVLITASLLYFAMLFGLAHWADKRQSGRMAPRTRRIIYGLALAVYCTSWSFYGTSGQAMNNGWVFPPTYVGVILSLYILGRPIEKIISISQRQNIASIADFIASRYGKSQALGAVVAVLALIVAVPYIALQLKAITASLDIASNGTLVQVDTSLMVAGFMGVFAIFFAAKRVESAGHNNGLMLAVAFESLVKFIMFAVVGITAVLFLSRNTLSVPPLLASGLNPAGPWSYISSIALGAITFAILPRQFHILAVETSDTSDFRQTRNWFAFYLLVMGVLVWPITHWGQMVTGGSDADFFALSAPMAEGRPVLALAVYIGGIAASTGMILVSTVALAVMISNNIVTPLLLRFRAIQTGGRRDVTRLLRIIRRLSIALVLALAFGYHRLIDGFEGLANSGLLAMTLAAQFTPATFIGLYWKQGKSSGAILGMLAGAVLWVGLLFLPSLAQAGIIETDFFANGLFGVSFSNSVTLGLFWSLAINTAIYVWVSLSLSERGIDRIQAETFVAAGPVDNVDRSFRQATCFGDLRLLAERFVGVEAARKAYAGYFHNASGVPDDKAAANAETIAMTERLLSGALGVASARVVMNAVLRGINMDIGDAVSIIDEAANVFRFNRDLLQASMNTVPIGISVVDNNLHLVAWNKAYEEMFRYPKGSLYEGQPAADLIRYNSERGECGEGAPEQHVRKRINFMTEGSAYVIQRPRADGRVIEITGRPMPGGGFVTSYADITAFKQVEMALRVANETLEVRVEERTTELAEAKDRAEHIERAKTRFFAAISHDVLQPLNAAKLFASSLETRIEDEQGEKIVEHLGQSLENVGALLEKVLDLSKIEAGDETLTLTPVRLGDVFSALATEFEEQAAQKGLQLHFVPTALIVHTDSRDLYRILQNLIGNAIKYSKTGRVLFGARRLGRHVRIDVCDTGIGISDKNLKLVFREFQRISPDTNIEGLGLGLAIVERLARRLDHKLEVRSKFGHGSVFSLHVPRSFGAVEPLVKRTGLTPNADFSGLQILCVDNDRAVRAGMQTLLSDWGAKAKSVGTSTQALACADQGFKADIAILDYHLDDGSNGLKLAQALRAQLGIGLPCILISADDTALVRDAAKAMQVKMLRKPLRAGALRALIANLAGLKQGAAP